MQRGYFPPLLRFPPRPKTRHDYHPGARRHSSWAPQTLVKYVVSGHRGLLGAAWRPPRPLGTLRRPPGDSRSLRGTILEPFWMDFEPPGPQKTSKNAILSAFFAVFAFSKGTIKKKLKSLQKSSPGAQNQPQERPRSGPRGPQTAPRAARNAPRALQERPQIDPRPDQEAQEAPRAPHGRPEIHFVRFSPLQGTILVPFWPILSSPFHRPPGPHATSSLAYKPTSSRAS